MILITGGTGTIGSAVVRHLAAQGRAVCVLSRNDTRQYELRNSLSQDEHHFVKFVIGDVRNLKDVERAIHFCRHSLKGVIHCAALKHVWAAEENPEIATAVNVEGTRNVLQAFALTARDRPFEHSPRVLLLSTDKAAAPTTVMGMTKYVAEQLVLCQEWPFRTGVVRFGNVTYSNGSVLPTWEKSILTKEAVKVTNFNVTRYLISQAKAAHTVVDAFDDMKYFPPSIYIPKMDARTLRQMFETLCETLKVDPDDIKQEVIGLQKGEKLHESCLTTEGLGKVYSWRLGGIRVVPSERSTLFDEDAPSLSEFLSSKDALPAKTT